MSDADQIEIGPTIADQMAAAGVPDINPAKGGHGSGWSRQERQARIAVALKLLTTGWTPAETERLLAGRFDITTRTARKFIALARRKMLTVLDCTPEEMVATLVSNLMSIVRKPNANENAKVKAMAEIAKLTGAYAPSKAVVAHIDGHSMADVLRLVEQGHKAPVVDADNVDKIARKAAAKLPDKSQEKPAIPVVIDAEPATDATPILPPPPEQGTDT